MKVYTYTKQGFTAIALAFNRGHAVKQIAKELESRGLEIGDEPVSEIDTDDPEFKRGKVFVLSDERNKT